MTRVPKPCDDNDFLAQHVALLRDSFRRCTGRELASAQESDCVAARDLFHAPFVLLSHNTDSDPVFNYANETALALFGMSWEEITALPSRLSADAGDQPERQRLLAEVARKGFIDDYRGVRVAKGGRRFFIERATVWNIVDLGGTYHGQAATFRHWRFLD